MTFQTPDLHGFILTWDVERANLPGSLANEEFLSERLIEDIMDEEPNVSFAIVSVTVPMVSAPDVSHISVRFRIVCHLDDALKILASGHHIEPEFPNRVDWPKDESDGMTWTDLLSMVNGHMRPLGPELDKPVRATDDNDPNAPWFKLMGVKQDDDGWFIAIEEIEP